MSYIGSYFRHLEAVFLICSLRSPLVFVTDNTYTKKDEIPNDNHIN